MEAQRWTRQSQQWCVWAWLTVTHLELGAATLWLFTTRELWLTCAVKSPLIISTVSKLNNSTIFVDRKETPQKFLTRFYLESEPHLMPRETCLWTHLKTLRQLVRKHTTSAFTEANMGITALKINCCSRGLSDSCSRWSEGILQRLAQVWSSKLESAVWSYDSTLWWRSHCELWPQRCNCPIRDVHSQWP